MTGRQLLFRESIKSLISPAEFVSPLKIVHHEAHCHCKYLKSCQYRQSSSSSQVVAIVASVQCEAEADAYTLGQVAAGLTNGGIITGVHHSNGLVSAYGAVPHLAYAAGHGVSNVANTVGISGLAPAAR